MKLVRQPVDSHLCGQACVAMLAGVSLGEAIEVVGHQGKTKTRMLVKALKELGVYPSGTRCRRQRPEVGLGRLYWGDRRNWHWVVISGENIYDPEAGVNPQYLKHERITSFLEVVI